MNCNGKRILVTGGAKGIGRALVATFLSEGAQVCVLDVDLEGMKVLENDFPEVIALECDVSDPEAVETSISSAVSQLGGLDIVINNAAVIHSDLFLNLTAEGLKTYDPNDWKRVMSVNLDGVFYVTSSVVKQMSAVRTKGVIINISSICAAGNRGQSAYSAAKAGVDALTVTLSKELSYWGIRVAGLAPGFVETETTIGSMSESTLEDWKKQTPLRRMAKPEEIVKGVLFIIQNDFFNGRTLQIDGGLRI